MFLLILTATVALVSAGKSWSKGHDHHSNHVDVSGPTSHLERLEVVCSRDHMTVHMHFDGPFYGVVFSHGGSSRHERCVHIGPRSGVTSMSFDIRYDTCGTKEDRGGQFHENTIVIQYDEDILEAWDQAKRLRCEWLESFEKQSSKPTLAISDLDIVELNFQGDDIDCWMEVQEGKGPWARQVSGLVPIGNPLTLVIAINDHSREFDMRIKRCSASDGTGSEIELTDDKGCVLRPSLMTPFAKVRDFGGKATLVAYSHLFAFKFPDKMDVFVHCIVEVCRHGCPDSCSHQYKDYHRPGEAFDNLESKKIEKLANFANSKSVHEVHVSGHHHHHQQLQTSASGIPLPGREKIREILVPAAQKQIQHAVLKNTSLNAATFENRKVVAENQRATFSPELYKAAKEAKSQVESASSNAQGVFVDIENALHVAQNSKFSSHSSHQHSQDIPVPTAHRIIGHDIHWISEGVKEAEGDHGKHISPSLLKDVSYQSPQPEPSAWSADEVKPLTKQEVFQPQKSELDTGVHHYHSNIPYVTKMQWSSDDAKSHETFPPILQKKQVPQPEPATWKFEEVNPIYSPEEKIQWSSVDTKSHTTFPPVLQKKQVPQPEPASWTFEEVNPMHSPEVVRLQLHTKRPQEPKPEPSSWSLDDVKGFNRENLRTLSLNHKMKSHSHVVAPVYKEFVHPYSTTILPEPVYVSRYTLSPRNMSSPSMMKMMMMMMPTMLPPTYQTAHWPQRTTARYLRPQRHHYPYPIPQFSPHQQMMMSVIADRRMDGENEDSLEDLSLYHNLDDGAEPRRVQIGETASSPEQASDDNSRSHLDLEDIATDKITLEDLTSQMTSKQVAIGETFHGQTTPESRATTEDILNDASYISVSEPDQSTVSVLVHEIDATPKGDSSEQTIKLDEASGGRPAISSFVPPSLDAGMGANPESKDRVVPGPRSLDRRKRSSEPVFGVRQKFQAIAPSDLAFEWNLTTDGAAILRGRREEIVYGICMSPAGMSASVGFILILTLLSIIASVVFYEHSCQLSNKTSQLSFLTRNFNGQIEALYKFTRPYLYSDNRNVR